MNKLSKLITISLMLVAMAFCNVASAKGRSGGGSHSVRSYSTHTKSSCYHAPTQGRARTTSAGTTHYKRTTKAVHPKSIKMTTPHVKLGKIVTKKY